MRLLLVEDEKRMAQALTEILRLEGYETDCCTDGRSVRRSGRLFVVWRYLSEQRHIIPGMRGEQCAFKR